MITLLCLNKKELESFVNSGEYSTFDFLPITKHRALSQIKNEKADADKIILIGHSRGGGISIIKSFEDERIHGLITLASVDTLDRFPKNDASKNGRKLECIMS